MKTKVKKSYKSALEAKSKIGEQMNTLREEIKAKLVEKKQLESPVDLEVSSTADVLADRKRKERTMHLDDEIDQLAGKLQGLHDQVDTLNDDINQHKAELFKKYVSKCDELQQDLFKKISEAEKINDKLKAIEGDHWEELSLARAGFRSPYLPQWNQVSGWIKQHQTKWERMKDTKLKQ